MSACVPIACLFVVLSAGRSNCGGTASGVVGKFHGYTLMVSSSCLSYLSGMICLRIVLALMTLPGMPTIDSPVIVSLPSQIPLKNLGSILGCLLLLVSCIVLFLPSRIVVLCGPSAIVFGKLVCPSLCMAYLFSSQAACRTIHGMTGCCTLNVRL